MSINIRIEQLVITLFVLIAAIVQWMVLVERTWSLIWEWYKFYGYGDGQITLGKNTQILFYLLSSLTALVGYMLSRCTDEDDPVSHIRRRLNRISALALVLGMLFWTGILISPLATFR